MRFNEIILKSFSETNLDKKELLSKHEQQERIKRWLRLEENFRSARGHRQYVAVLMKYVNSRKKNCNNSPYQQNAFCYRASNSLLFYYYSKLRAQLYFN